LSYHSGYLFIVYKGEREQRACLCHLAARQEIWEEGNDMSIKSEHLPEEFLKIFRLYDEPGRTKKDVAYLIWCAIKDKESK